jgi:dTDP-4-amino-4,6-dideoxygalactose transaminase
LDTVQAAILRTKLKHIDSFVLARQRAADIYDALLEGIAELETPFRAQYASHVFHQYTVKLPKGMNRDEVQSKLKDRGVPSMVYYPKPLHVQAAFKYLGYSMDAFPVANTLSECVISLPMHTELTEAQQVYIASTLRSIVEGY